MLIEKRDAKIVYSIPAYCQMPLEDHFDGMGGCWGISHGLVQETNGEHCNGCEYKASDEEMTDGVIARMDALETAVPLCEWCEMVACGNEHISKSRFAGTIWVHDDADGNSIPCEAAHCWKQFEPKGDV